MRILSQDGNCDFPYDDVGLSIGYKGDKNEFYIFCHNKLQDNGIKIAEYSTESKARKAMEMLREEYTFEKQFETICFGTTYYPSRPTYYFQFPQDSEVEV